MNQDRTPADGEDPPAAPAASTKPARSVVWPLVAVGALLLGLLVGYNAPGRNPVAVEPTGQTTAPSTASTPRATSGDATVAARAQVNAACLRALNDAENVYVVLSGLDAAVSDVDLRSLDQMVRDLQPLQKLLQRDLSECEVNTSVSNGESEAPPPPPAATTAPARPRTVTGSPSMAVTPTSTPG